MKGLRGPGAPESGAGQEDADGLVRVPSLRDHTPARVSLERAGTSLATREQMLFQLDHALARDAVHDAAGFPSLLRGLRERGLEGLQLESAVGTRAEYLRRPDLGRRLSAESAETLRGRAEGTPEVVLVLADGLSALALDRNGLALVDALRSRLPLEGAPVCLVRNGRVAIGDEIGHALGAEMVVVLIGERPGLSAPDSLGAYLTWAPQAGRTDAERNCISNIRTGGLAPEEAGERIAAYAEAARRGKMTGFALKQPVGAGRLG